MKCKRVQWLDIIKIVACFLVVSNHALDEFLLKFIDTSRPFSFTFSSIQLCFSRIANSLFLMSTGALLIGKNYKFKDSIKKIMRVVIPLLIISVFASFVLNKEKNFSIIKFFEEPTISLYWYLYVLIGFYLLLPLIQKMIKKLENKDYIYMFILCFIIPGVIQYLKYLNINISYHFISIFFPTLLVFPIMGYYLSKLDKTKKNRNKAWIIFLSSSIIYIVTFFLFYFKYNKIEFIYIDCANLFVGLMSTSFFYLIRYYFEDKKENSIIKNISLTTFGIYLVHILLQSKVINSLVVMNLFNINSIVAVVVSEILIFSLSSIFIYLIRKIPIVRKFL